MYKKITSLLVGQAAVSCYQQKDYLMSIMHGCLYCGCSSIIDEWAVNGVEAHKYLTITVK